MKSFILFFAFYVLVLHPTAGVRGQSRSIMNPVGTERRIALVMGNANYAHFNNLTNPLNDANDMEKALQKLGFEVIKTLNNDRAAMGSAISNFRDRLSSADVAFFYYAGHGASFDNKSYLLPTDFDANCLEQIEDYGIALSRVLGDIAAKNVKNSFVVLDACRDIPSLRICNATKRDLGSSSALVKPTNNPRGSMVVYATEDKAEDRSPNGRNGLFTGALLQYLTTPDLTLRNIIDQASLEVERLSNGTQTPARYDKIYGDFYFLKTEGYTPPPDPKRRGVKFLDLPFSEMVYVEGGSFEMGDTRNEGASNEKPVHSVRVSSFLMGKYEVTQRQWREIMGSDPPELYNKNCDDCPVEGVSWNDIQEFLKKLNARTGGTYRLPTEAEWEYAAGGGSTNRSRFGNGKSTIAPAEANFDASAAYKKGYSEVGEYRDKTIRVGSFIPNVLGIYDLSGNVWEWCSDWYGPYPNTSQTNPTGVATGSDRVLRGGSWLTAPINARVAFRSTSTPDSRRNYCGFRLVSQFQ